MVTWQEQITQALGDAANRSGVFSETAGRIFAVLYLSPGALSLDEIAEALGTSKGNASVQVRELLALGMVRKVWVRRSRRDYYEAVTDLWAIATQVIARRLEQEAQALSSALEAAEPELLADPYAGDVLKTRIASMKLFLQITTAMLDGFRRGETLETALLRKAGA
jgi:DNA-binding transcriptional regulator GbsR (MarR family)